MKSDRMTQSPTLSTNDLTQLHCAVHGVLLRVPVMWPQVSRLGYHRPHLHPLTPIAYGLALIHTRGWACLRLSLKYALLHVPLSRAQAPQLICVLPSASMVIQYRGASLLTMRPKWTASSTNSSDSCIANMSSTRFRSSCTAASPLNCTCLTDPLGMFMTAGIGNHAMLQPACTMPEHVPISEPSNHHFFQLYSLYCELKIQ